MIDLYFNFVVNSSVKFSHSKNISICVAIINYCPCPLAFFLTKNRIIGNLRSKCRVESSVPTCRSRWHHTYAMHTQYKRSFTIFRNARPELHCDASQFLFSTVKYTIYRKNMCSRKASQSTNQKVGDVIGPHCTQHHATPVGDRPTLYSASCSPEGDVIGPHCTQQRTPVGDVIGPALYSASVLY